MKKILGKIYDKAAILIVFLIFLVPYFLLGGVNEVKNLIQELKWSYADVTKE